MALTKNQAVAILETRSRKSRWSNRIRGEFREVTVQIGYARVSTSDQCLDLQVQALWAAGCEKIFTDTASGAKPERERPGLMEAMACLSPGMTLVTWKLDRLGRGVKGLVALVGDLEAKGCQFRSLTESIDTSSPAGRLFFHLLAAFGQMERELIIERTQAGLESGRLRGRFGGRPRKMTVGKVESARELLNSGMPPRDVATNLGVSIATLYRWLPGSSRHGEKAGI